MFVSECRERIALRFNRETRKERPLKFDHRYWNPAGHDLAAREVFNRLREPGLLKLR